MPSRTSNINLASSQKSSKELYKKLGQYEVILDINNAIVSKLNYEDLFKAIATTLKVNFPLDCTAVTIYNKQKDEFEVTAIEPFSSSVELFTGFQMPRKGSHMEWVWKNKKPLKANNIEKHSRFDSDPILLEQGLISYIVLPLMSRSECIGTFNIGSAEPSKYTQEDIDFAEVVANQITMAIENVKQHHEIKKLSEQLQKENVYLQEEIKTTHNFEEIITQNKNYKKMLASIEQVATTSASVLILGESGTGKELLAMAVHNRSKLANKALVKVNCAALPENLIESELLGHENGAFTGALTQKLGRFELADRGTILLDEIGEMPIQLQTKLLRVLQEGEFERLGNPHTHKVKVRVIAATNKDLAKAIEKGEFREDLYYRLNVFPITSTPLRERKDDIPLLANHFCQKYNRIFGRSISSITEGCMKKLQSYDWPGNVRELENIIERAVIISKGKTLYLGDLQVARKTTSDKILPFEDNQRAHILKVLKLTNWKISGPNGAAQLLDLNPKTLESKMRNLGIKRGNLT